MARKAEAVEIAGVRVTSPEKVLYPEQGITKRALAEYYVAVADWVLPAVAGRPLSLVRCPAGRKKACFFQKHVGAYVPEEVRRVEIPGGAPGSSISEAGPPARHPLIAVRDILSQQLHRSSSRFPSREHAMAGRKATSRFR